MKKLIAMIRQKDREEKSKVNTKKAKANAKEDKIQAPSESHEQSTAKPRELFWDDYSDVGYC